MRKNIWLVMMSLIIVLVLASCNTSESESSSSANSSTGEPTANELAEEDESTDRSESEEDKQDTKQKKADESELSSSDEEKKQATKEDKQTDKKKDNDEKDNDEKTNDKKDNDQQNSEKDAYHKSVKDKANGTTQTDKAKTENEANDREQKNVKSTNNNSSAQQTNKTSSTTSTNENKSTASNEKTNETKNIKKQESKPKKQRKKTDVQVSKASGTYYVTTSKLNVRSGDGSHYRQLGSLGLNSKVNVTGKTTKGWYQFNYKGQKGYVSGNYLSNKKSTTTAKKNNTSNKNNSKSTSSNNKGSSSNKGSSASSSGKGKQNVVDKMKNLGSSRQVILITTKGSSTYTGRVRTFEKGSNGKWNQQLSATAYIGKNGFASNKREGDGKSPTGKYTIGHAFGFAGKPTTKLPFKRSTSNDVWVDDSNSKYYNTWQSKNKSDKDWNSAESMRHELYKYGFVINYNTAQTPNKGSAIFMHVARPGTGYTTGCTAVNESDLLKIMRWVDPSKNPVIIQTPESGLSNY